MGITPHQADALTLAEIVVLLDDGEREIQSTEQVQAELRRWASLSPKERLLSRKAAR